MVMRVDIQRQVGDYYSDKIRRHGATPRGVDWNSEESQRFRFDQLLKVADRLTNFSVNEIGCGYGALIDYLEAQDRDFHYHGVDLSTEMVDAARQQHPQTNNITFAVGGVPDRPRDFCLASGIFNVRLDIPDEIWQASMGTILDMMHENSTAGFAFNALTIYSDADKMRDYLYYADPLKIFDYCKKRYSRDVALLHDYGLFEFTILVRKSR